MGAAGEASSPVSPPRIAPDMPSGEAFAITGRACLAALIKAEDDALARRANGVHQMRVALRRMRALLSVFKRAAMDDEREALRLRLKALSAELAPARDLDVFLADVMTPLLKQAPQAPGLAAARRALAARRDRAARHAADALREPDYRALTAAWGGWIENGAWRAPEDEARRALLATPIADFAASELRRRRRRIARLGKRIGKSSVAERHRLRIRGKKLRYAIEFLADAFPARKSGKRRKRLLRDVKDLLDALGRLNDIATRERLTMQFAFPKVSAESGAQRERAFAAGMMFGAEQERFADLIAAADKAWRRVADDKPFWT